MRYTRPAGALVALSALCAYWPVLGNRFVNADDERWLFGTPSVHEGLSRLIALAPNRAGYMPLGLSLNAWIYRFLGHELFPYHAIALILHAACATLLFFMILRLLELGSAESSETGRVVSAAAASVLFAVHPLHAETLAVAAAVTDPASYFLFVAALGLWLRSTEDAPRRWRWLGASLLTYVLCGLTRWTAVGLPFVLVVLDVYPLKRRAWAEKIPYFLIAGGVFAANAYAKLSSSEAVYGAAVRPGAAAVGVVFYFWKWLWPGDVTYYYILDRPEALFGLSVMACAALLAAAAALLVWARRRAPAALAAGAACLILLAPTLGAATSGWLLAHNRFAYLPGMALSAALAAGLLASWRRATIPFLVAGLAAAGFAAQSRELAADWHDKPRLAAATLGTDADAFFAHNALGEALLRRKDYGGAVLQFRAQLALRPGDAKARKRLDEYGSAAEAEAENGRGLALAVQGRTDEAIASFRRAVALRPDFEPARRNLALLLKTRAPK